MAVFGSWPSFHHAEVQWLRFDRHVPWSGRACPAIDVQIHAFGMTGEIDANRVYVLRNHVLVHLWFSEVNEFQMEGSNQQNVLFELILAELPDPQVDHASWKVRFHASYGMDASFRCAAIEVISLVPCNENDESE